MDEQIAQARQALAAMRNGEPASGRVPVRAQAKDADDRIRVAAEDRRLTRLELDARLLRKDAAELAAELSSAINAALDGTRDDGSPAEDVPPVDMEAIGRSLNAVLDESLLSLERFTSALHEAVTQIRQRAVVPGEADRPDLEGLLAGTREALETVRAAPADSHGVGEALDGRIRAVAVPPGRVTELAISQVKSTVELSDGVLEAVNAALAETERQARDQTARSSGEVTEAVQAIQDLSVRQMSGYLESLRTLMNGIEPRS